MTASYVAGIRTLILAPTRELATQIHDEAVWADVVHVRTFRALLCDCQLLPARLHRDFAKARMLHSFTLIWGLEMPDKNRELVAEVEAPGKFLRAQFAFEKRRQNAPGRK